MTERHSMRAVSWMSGLALFALLGSSPGRAAGPPPTPFAEVVEKYVDTLLASGRDTYGPQKSGLFLSALDRKTLKPLENRPPAPAGIRESDRPGPAAGPLVGANPQLDQNLIRLLFLYGGWKGEKYPKAAEDQLSWFLKNTQSPATGLLPWGEHLSWNVLTDQVASGAARPMHEFARPWVLWDKCFQVAPAESRRFALALWESQVADHETAAFDRHAAFDKPAPQDGKDFPRHAGFYIRTWAEAYAHTQDQTFLKAIDVMLSRFEKKRHPTTGFIEMSSGSKVCMPALSLSLAIDCDGASRKVPNPLAARLSAFAAREDKLFCSLAHDLKGRKGFVAEVDLATGTPTGKYTPVWQAGYGQTTTAAMAMMCVSRYENSAHIGYRNLIAATADAYLSLLPGPDVDLWPMTLGHVISLQLAAFRSTTQEKYHHWAYTLGHVAVADFWGDSPLPRASLKSDHYESITGADTLALALEELWVSARNINGVYVPANTLDR